MGFIACRCFLVGTIFVMGVFVAGRAVASPLTYDVDESESSLGAGLSTTVMVTFSIGGAPGEATLGDSAEFDLALSGSALVDTGLPEDFAGGSHGVQITGLSIGAEASEGEVLMTLSDASTIWDPIRQASTVTSMTAEVYSVFTFLNAPVSTELIPEPPGVALSMAALVSVIAIGARREGAIPRS